MDKPNANAAAVRREICRRLPYNDVYSRGEWARRSRGYWIESTGLGLNLGMTVLIPEEYVQDLEQARQEG